MLFSKSVEAIIQERKSIRTYKVMELPLKDKNALNEFINRNMQTPFNSELRFEIIETAGLERSQVRSLGTYGMINGAKNFIAGTIKKDENTNGKPLIAVEKFIDYGFAMEKIILYLTDEGFGTCWLGGTFNKAGFSKKINLADNEIIPAVTPFGYVGTRRALLDKLIRQAAGSKFRKKWEEVFFTEDFTTSLPIDEAGIYSKPLEMVRIAPSASNKQPWRILKDKNGQFFHLFLKRTKNYANFGADMQALDMGIAMCHFELTCRDIEIKGMWQKLDFPDILEPAGIKIWGADISYIATWVS